MPECVTRYLKQQTLVEAAKGHVKVFEVRPVRPSALLRTVRTARKQYKLMIGTLDVAKAKVFPWHLKEVTLMRVCFPSGS